MVQCIHSFGIISTKNSPIIFSYITMIKAKEIKQCKILKYHNVFVYVLYKIKIINDTALEK